MLYGFNLCLVESTGWRISQAETKQYNARLRPESFIQFAFWFPQVTVRNLCDAAELVCKLLG